MPKVLERRLQNRQLPALTDLKLQFEDLCAWIDAQIDEPLGWQELMQQSGLDHQTIKALFFKYASTTPMTWIRQRREARATAPRYTAPAVRALQHQAA
jgi:methylphosphotriester-DNA--protein-cysteine methyltransferase